MVQTQMRAEIAGVMLPGLGHATRATGDTARGRHGVPVMRVYAWGIRTVVEEWQEQRAHTLLRSHRLPVPSGAGPFLSKSGRSVSAGTSLGERGRGDCLMPRRHHSALG